MAQKKEDGSRTFPDGTVIKLMNLAGDTYVIAKRDGALPSGDYKVVVSLTEKEATDSPTGCGINACCDGLSCGIL